MKFNPTNQHFKERRPDRVFEFGLRMPIPPLHKEFLSPHCWGEIKPSRQCTYVNFVEPFQTMPKNFRLFLDTGFITSHELPQEFWNLIVEKRVFITKGVWSELQPWVNRPHCNKWFRDYLVDAVELEESGKGHHSISLATINDFPSDLMLVADYYIRLLWMRKYFAIHQLELFKEKNGREPDLENELMPICQRISGARGWRIALKVLRERHRSAALTPVDEGIVVNALFHSILYGEPTIVLTRDNDVFEQWCKCIYLIDTHYQAMLLAEEYAAKPSSFRSIEAPECEQLYFGSGNVLLSPNFAHYILRSRECSSIQASCGLLSTSDKPLTHSERSFGLVSDMRRLLDIKSKTRGRNTDRFGSMNLHTELDPRRIAFGASGPALVNENVLPANNLEEFPISVTDSELSVFTNEQFSQEVIQVD